MSGFLRDVRFALRILGKAPALAMVAILTLGVAIGANTTVFSVVNAVILQPLPFPEPDRLVLLHTRSMGAGWQSERGAVSGLEYSDLVEHTHAYEAIGASMTRGVPVTAGSGPERVSAAFVAGPWFRAVGTAPLLGRAFSREEERPEQASVAILGYGLWQRAFGGDAGGLGKRVSIDGNLLTVVGVMPAGFWPRSARWTRSCGRRPRGRASSRCSSVGSRPSRSSSPRSASSA